jgi:acyl-homoserine lactone acylase PvdQ
MQLDTFSPVDAEIAHFVARSQQNATLQRWDGRFDRNSVAATLAHDIRTQLLENGNSLPLLLAQLRTGARSGEMSDDVASIIAADARTPRAWSAQGAVSVDHPLSPFWYGMLAGTPLPGEGDEYTIHLQEPGFAQGFRAVWDAENWDTGGISIPSGESGEPGSPHYDDAAPAWIAGRLEPLPFSLGSVKRASVMTLTLTPSCGRNSELCGEPPRK